jgi:hypothetical protein
MDLKRVMIVSVPVNDQQAAKKFSFVVQQAPATSA